MRLSDIHFFSSCALREKTPVSNANHAPKNDAISVGSNSAPTSEPESHKATQIPSCMPRARSDHHVWGAIKSFSAWTAQNIMALVQTGRLKSTLVENFKKSLERAPSDSNKFEYGEIYKSRNALLDIGCNLSNVMKDFQSVLPENSYENLEKNLDCFESFISEDAIFSKTSFGKDLVCSAFSAYFASYLKGEILSAHSILKDVEKLLSHMSDDGFDISKIRDGAWADARNKIIKSIFEAKRSATTEAAVLEVRDLEKVKYVKEKLSSLVNKIQNQRGNQVTPKVFSKLNGAKNTRKVSKTGRKTDVQKQGQKPGDSDVGKERLFPSNQPVEPSPRGSMHTYKKTSVQNGSTQQTEESKKISFQVKEVFSALSNLNLQSQEASLTRAAYSLIKLCSMVSQGTSLDDIKNVLSRQFSRLDVFKREKIVACSSSSKMHDMDLTGSNIRASIGMKINQDAVDALNKNAGSAGKMHGLEDIQRSVDLVLDAVMGFKVEESNGLGKELDGGGFSDCDMQDATFPSPRQAGALQA